MGYWAGAIFDDSNHMRKTDTVLNLGGDDDSFGSYHPGGTHFLFGDGRVQFISQDIDITVDASADDVNKPRNYGVYNRLGAMNDGLATGQY